MILTVIQITFFTLFFLINFNAPKINHFMDDAILTIAMVISDCLLLQDVAYKACVHVYVCVPVLFFSDRCLYIACGIFLLIGTKPSH